LEAGDKSCTAIRRRLYYDFIPSRLAPPLVAAVGSEWIGVVVRNAASSKWATKQVKDIADVENMAVLLVDKIFLNVQRSAFQRDMFAVEVSSVLSTHFADGRTSLLMDALLLRAVVNMPYKIDHANVRNYGGEKHLVYALLEQLKTSRADLSSERIDLIMKYFEGKFDIASLLGTIPTKLLQKNEPAATELASAVTTVLAHNHIVGIRLSNRKSELDFVVELVRHIARLALAGKGCINNCYDDPTLEKLLQQLDKVLGAKDGGNKALAQATNDLRMHHTFYHDAGRNIQLAVEETLEVGNKSCTSIRRRLYYDFIPSRLIQPLKTVGSDWIRTVVELAAKSTWDAHQSTKAHDIQLMGTLLVERLLFSEGVDRDRLAHELTDVIPLNFRGTRTSRLVDALVLRAVVDIPNKVGHSMVKHYGGERHLVENLLASLKTPNVAFVLKYSNTFDILAHLGNIPTMGQSDNEPTVQSLSMAIADTLSRDSSEKLGKDELAFVASLVSRVNQQALLTCFERCHDDDSVMHLIKMLDELEFRHKDDQLLSARTTELRLAIEFYDSDEENVVRAVKEVLAKTSLHSTDALGKPRRTCSSARRYLYLNSFLPKTLVPKLKPTNTHKWATNFLLAISTSVWIGTTPSATDQQHAVDQLVLGLALNDKSTDRNVFAAHLTDTLGDLKERSENWLIQHLIEQTLLLVPNGIGHFELEQYAISTEEKTFGFIRRLLSLIVRESRIDPVEKLFIEQYADPTFDNVMMLIRLFSQRAPAIAISTKDPTTPNMNSVLAKFTSELQQRVFDHKYDKCLALVLGKVLELVGASGRGVHLNGVELRPFLEQLNVRIVNLRSGVDYMRKEEGNTRCGEARVNPHAGNGLLAAIRRFDSKVLYENQEDPKIRLQMAMDEISKYGNHDNREIAKCALTYMHQVQCIILPEILRLPAETSWMTSFFVDVEKIKGMGNNFNREETCQRDGSGSACVVTNFVEGAITAIVLTNKPPYNQFVAAELKKAALRSNEVQMKPSFEHVYYNFLADKISGIDFQDEKAHIESARESDLGHLLGHYFQKHGSADVVMGTCHAFENGGVDTKQITRVAQLLGKPGTIEVDFSMFATVFQIDIRGVPAAKPADRSQVLALLGNRGAKRPPELALVLSQVKSHPQLGWANAGFFGGNFDVSAKQLADQIYQTHKDSNNAAVKAEATCLKRATFGPVCSMFGWFPFFNSCYDPYDEHTPMQRLL
jgi:hypothetical protein